MKEQIVVLGDKVKDKISGFIGVATARHSYLNGCDRITVQPPIDSKRHLPNSATFDEPQLKVLKRQTFLQGSRIPGGTEKYIDEGRQ